MWVGQRHRGGDLSGSEGGCDRRFQQIAQLNGLAARERPGYPPAYRVGASMQSAGGHRGRRPADGAQVGGGQHNPWLERSAGDQNRTQGGGRGVTAETERAEDGEH